LPAIRITQVDAFAETMFQGNPAAVCITPFPLEDSLMQQIAGEMNLSETAFVVPMTPGNFSLRWFTPKTEVKLCGHATLASAHILWQNGYLALEQPAIFHTKSGELRARLCEGQIELEFPLRHGKPWTPTAGLVAALGQPTIRRASAFERDVLLELASEQEVVELKPSMSGILEEDVRVVIVTAKAQRSGFDFVSRVFAPAVGIPEDPVTGSAHCFLASYWAEELSMSEMRAFQASERGGALGVRVNQTQVWLSGKAITVMDGFLMR
jgi:PhzF family phenazine biosynthesis protein